MITDLAQEHWCDVNDYLDHDIPVYDDHGVAWLRKPRSRSLHRVTADRQSLWDPDSDDIVYLDAPPIPEPPDGARIEFNYGTDRYAAWRNDASSVEAGWRPNQGWCLYGQTVPCSWAVMWLQFGESLRDAVRLVPAEVAR